jgi:hypothetical protein
MSRRIEPGSSNGVGASMRIDRGGNSVVKASLECPYLPPGWLFVLPPYMLVIRRATRFFSSLLKHVA